VGLYTGYFDEGNDEESPVMTMGGIVIDVERAADFDSDWREAIKELPFGSDGFPQLHMTDFVSGYRKFNDSEKNSRHKIEILRKAASVISKHGFCIISCVLDVDGFVKLNQEIKLSELLGTPYAVLARYSKEHLNDWSKAQGLAYRPRMVLEQRHGSGEVNDLFINDNQDVPIPGNKELCALQAADYVAWMRQGKSLRTRNWYTYRESWKEINQFLSHSFLIDRKEMLRVCGLFKNPSPLRGQENVLVRYESYPNKKVRSMFERGSTKKKRRLERRQQKITPNSDIE
jgi:hypothetical protein